jgi:nicotinamide-nucleotide amidase
VKGVLAKSSRIEVLFTGSELLEGRPNTHQNYLALRLKNAGLSLRRATTVPDDEKVIASAVTEIFSRSDVLIICGGLGPTFDDLTRDAVARALDRRLIYSSKIFNQIRARFLSSRVYLAKENKKQAYFIEGAKIIKNPLGSAPGQILEIAREKKSPQTLILLPGPFAEMSPLFEEIVLPRLKNIYGRGRFVEHLAVHLSGISESAADEKLANVTSRGGSNASFMILGLAGQVDYHATVWGATRSDVKKRIQAIKTKIIRSVGPFIFGEGDETLEGAVGRELRRKRKTIAAAESCTAGGFCARITAVPGSSDYFRGGVVVYADEAKSGLLHVSPETIKNFGAVSAPCAWEMAEGVRKSLRSSFGVSITGIAGPSGGSAKKPLGLVFVGVAGFSKTPIAHELHLLGDRETIRKHATAQALHFLLEELRKI